MKDKAYVLLNPTGNLTCLVLDPVAAEERESVTAALMRRCEQVGYLERPRDPRARARLQMMGGEFCGNASMATAAFLAGRDGLAPGGETSVLLEVSGAESLLSVRVRRKESEWEGTVNMPPVLRVSPFAFRTLRFTAVDLPGMTHLIYDGRKLGKSEAEELLRSAAEVLPPVPAAGLLQWEEEAGRMTPLVFVRESGTMVWETACGSGTTAVAAWKALSAGKDIRLSVKQPGGILTADAVVRNEKVMSVRLTGSVQIGEETFLPAEEILPVPSNG